MQSTWAWRIPSLMQGIFAIASIAILPFIPESPRFLQSKGRTEDAIRSLAIITSNGDIDALAVVEQHEEIKLTLEWEKNQHVSSAKHILKQPSLRKRLNLTISVALIGETTVVEACTQLTWAQWRFPATILSATTLAQC